jgi:hypothetical protein
MKRPWLESYTWTVVVETNRQLCQPKQALHKPTSDGYECARTLWESAIGRPMALAEAVELCRRCHQLAPFCNFNGNTFVAIIRRVISTLDLPPEQSAALRSLAGHIVAGTATPEEQALFEQALAKITPQP